MPNDLRAKFLVGTALQKAEQAFKAYLTRIDALF